MGTFKAWNKKSRRPSQADSGGDAAGKALSPCTPWRRGQLSAWKGGSWYVRHSCLTGVLYTEFAPLRVSLERLTHGKGAGGRTSTFRFRGLLLADAGDDAVDDAVLLGLLGAHEVVAVGVLFDLLHRLTGVFG